MPDPRFYRRAGPFPLREIGTRTDATMAPSGTPDLSISDVAGLHAGGPSDLAYISEANYLPALAASKAGACFVTEKWAASAPSGMSLLIVNDPRAAFAIASALFYPDTHSSPANLPPPSVAADAEIASTAVLANGVLIGTGARVGHGAVIGASVSVGAGSVIAAHVTLSHCTIGARTIIHPGVRIGQDGFGFAPGGKGIIKIPQLGRVIIGDEVEIGANSTVDRGALEDTVIGDGTKIDNLVQIGHNVVIGRMCLIAAKVGISGSCHIGDGVMIGGDAGLANHVVVGNGAKIGAKAGVMREIGPGEAVMGYPAQPVRQFWREIATVSRLTRRDK